MHAWLGACHILIQHSKGLFACFKDVAINSLSTVLTSVTLTLPALFLSRRMWCFGSFRV